MAIDAPSFVLMNVMFRRCTLVRLLITWTALGIFGCRRQADTEHPKVPERPPATSTKDTGSGEAMAKAMNPTSSLRFESFGKETGLDHTFRDGQEAEVFSIVESLGGGVSIIDFDRDGRPDVLCPGGGTFVPRTHVLGYSGALFRGFEGIAFRNVSEPAGVDFRAFYNHAAIVGDFDNDGWDDVVVTGYGGLQLFRNQGDGTFEESARAARLDDSQWSSTAAWCDINRDGLLDLYIAHYANWSWDNDPACILPRLQVRDVCGPREFQDLNDSIYINSGDGTFRDATDEWQLAPGGRGLGVLAADLDGDGDLDIFVANDEQANFLYRNDGGKLVELGIRAGVAFDETGSPDGSMGIGLGDFNRDGNLDIFVTHYENETFALFKGLGRLNYTHASRATNITSLGNRFVGWGTSFADFDLDADEDILIVNGHAVRHSQTAPVEQMPILLENIQGRNFQWVRNGAGAFFDQPRPARGLAIVDWNEDGLIDAVTSSVNQPLVGLLNRSDRQGKWIGLNLIGTLSNRNAFGTTVIIEAGEQKWYRQIFSGGSYASSSSRSLLVGLSHVEHIDRIVVRWPGSEPTTFSNPQLDRYHQIVEGVTTAADVSRD